MNIEDRLNKLERESKSWRRIALGLALVCGVSLSCSQGTNAPIPPRAYADDARAPGTSTSEVVDKIRTRQLEIVDAEGKMVASLTSVRSGSILFLGSTDDSGNQANLSTASGPGCMLQDNDHEMYMDSTGISILRRDEAKRRGLDRLNSKIKRGEKFDESARKLYSELLALEDNPLCEIGISKTGGGIVDVFNPLGKKVVSIQADKSNKGMVVVSDLNGNHQEYLSPTR
ncbi:MAG: hypothetical protein WD049_09825 [Candidatus Paceibacterota bacterium]